jgi:4-hydroxy-tetrahydrodipicolinate synthase
LGTTGEATSFSLDARLAAMRAVASAGLPLDRVMVGTGAAALEDAAKLTAAARDLGYAGALLLPPFYYKNVDQESLLAYVRAVVGRVGADGLRLYLYHFPQNSGVPYAIDTVARLYEQFPRTLVGLKDSSGDPAYSRELARRVAGFDVFPGSETGLAEAKRSGLAGCISATTNVTGPLAQAFWQSPERDEGKRALAEAVAIREALGRHPFVASVKWALADLRLEPGWCRVMPPLRQLEGPEQRALSAALAATAYREMKSAGRQAGAG